LVAFAPDVISSVGSPSTGALLQVMRICHVKTAKALRLAVQGLQVELLGSLGGNEFHGRALHRLGNRLGITEVVLLSLGIRPNVFRRHRPGIVTKRLQFVTDMMRPTQASIPIKQGDRLASRASTWPRDHFCRSTIAPCLSWPTTWNEFLPISMPITATALLSLCDMACSLTLLPPYLLF
jgi:hypothetical protein